MTYQLKEIQREAEKSRILNFKIFRGICREIRGSSCVFGNNESFLTVFKLHEFITVDYSYYIVSIMFCKERCLRVK